MIASMMVGYSISPWIDLVLKNVLDKDLEMEIRGLVTWITVGILILYGRHLDKTWLAGHIAEKRVGDCIDAHLTRENYAMAHGVSSIGRGDIDHMIATPTNLWIIETKRRRLNPKRFKEALIRHGLARQGLE